MTTINTYQTTGNTVIPSTVSCSMESGIGIHVNGLSDGQVKEMLLRVATALNHTGYHFPGKKITIDISPRTAHSDGRLLDLPVAIAVLAETGVIKAPEDIFIAGSLGLSAETTDCGNLKDIFAVHSSRHDRTPLIIPHTYDVPETNVRHVRSLTETIALAAARKERRTFHILTNNDDAVNHYMRIRDMKDKDLEAFREYADNAVVITVNLHNANDIYEVLHALDTAGVGCALINEGDAETLRDILDD